MTIGEQLTETITRVAKDLGVVDARFVVEPTDLAHGDYATNIALVAGKALKKNPKELAESIAKALREAGDGMIADVTVAGPGFVNLKLTQKALSDAMKQEHLGWNDVLKGEKYIVEYTDPNPFKEFHIGHLMSNTIGEALSRLVEAGGAETKRACYQGDVGMHVASALWGKRKDPELPWGKAYALGATTYKNGTDEDKKEIVTLNKTIYLRSDSSVNDLYDEGKKTSLAYFEGIYQKLGTRFDHYFFESKTGAFGKEVVEEHLGTVFIKSDEAVVYKGDESKGLHTRVFINKEGLPTYEAKELGLAKIKYDAYPYDRSIIITANEVNDYFRVLLDAMGKVFPELASKTEHIGHGIMKLPTGKMSSRTGDVITAESMIADVKAKVLEKMAESEVPEKDAVAEMVAIGAIKYSILRQAPGKDIVFELDQATSFEGDSGPYLQYTYARTRQLLKKGEAKGMAPDVKHIEHGDLSRLLARFGDLVLRAQKDRAPQYVTTYLIQLSQEFNSYYGANLVVDEDDKPTSSGRLALVDSVGRTIKAGLWMLGIKAPEMM
jgi:arginyl-tRNA synthetase